MRFVFWIHTHLPLAEACQRLVGVMADLQAGLLCITVSDQISRDYGMKAITSCSPTYLTTKTYYFRITFDHISFRFNRL